jgi:hypothetical protein
MAFRKSMLVKQRDLRLFAAGFAVLSLSGCIAAAPLASELISGGSMAQFYNGIPGFPMSPTSGFPASTTTDSTTASSTPAAGPSWYSLTH